MRKSKRRRKKRELERGEWRVRGGVGEREAGFPPSREPDAGLDPMTLGSMI